MTGQPTMLDESLESIMAGVATVESEKEPFFTKLQKLLDQEGIQLRIDPFSLADLENPPTSPSDFRLLNTSGQVVAVFEIQPADADTPITITVAGYQGLSAAPKVRALAAKASESLAIKDVEENALDYLEAWKKDIDETVESAKADPVVSILNIQDKLNNQPLSFACALVDALLNEPPEYSTRGWYQIGILLIRSSLKSRNSHQKEFTILGNASAVAPEDKDDDSGILSAKLISASLELKCLAKANLDNLIKGQRFMSLLHEIAARPESIATLHYPSDAQALYTKDWYETLTRFAYYKGVTPEERILILNFTAGYYGDQPGAISDKLPLIKLLGKRASRNPINRDFLVDQRIVMFILARFGKSFHWLTIDEMVQIIKSRSDIADWAKANLDLS